MTFTALYEANVLHPVSLRDLLIRLAATGLFRARWTERILDETMESILRRRPDLDADRLARTRSLMCEAVANCLVVGYEPLIEALKLPGPDDRHVLAVVELLPPTTRGDIALSRAPLIVGYVPEQG